MARLGAIRNIGIGVVAKGWLQVIALVLALLAARILGKQDFGIYAIANVFHHAAPGHDVQRRL